MTNKSNQENQPSGIRFMVFLVIALIVLAGIAAVWKIIDKRSAPASPEPLPIARRVLLPVTPLPLERAAERLPHLDDEIPQFIYEDPSPEEEGSKVRTPPPGYVVALARLASLAGRPTRLWEAAALSRMAFEFHYATNPLQTDLLVNRYVTLFFRNAALEVVRFSSTWQGPHTIDEAATFLRAQFAANRPVLADHFEWNLLIGESLEGAAEPQFLVLGTFLSITPVPESRWRGDGWWRRPMFDWVHELVAVTGVYEQPDKSHQVERAAVAAVVYGSRPLPEIADLPEAYRAHAREMASGPRAYEQLAKGVEANRALFWWMADFPVQRLRFARACAAAYFRDGALHFQGALREHLLKAADAYRAEAEAWDDYVKLGRAGDTEWRRLKVQHIRRAAAHQQQALASLERFYLDLTLKKQL